MDTEKTLHNVYSYAGGLIEYVKWLNTDKVCLTFMAYSFVFDWRCNYCKVLHNLRFIFIKSCSICFNIFLLPIVRYDLHISGPEIFA